MNTSRFLAAGFACLLAAVAGTAGGTGDDLKAMQGLWAATITEMSGKPASPEEKNLKLQLFVEGDGYRVFADGKVIVSGTLRVDAGKTPRAIDATHTEGQFKGVVQRGIYEIQGDTMIAAFAKPGAERPTEFKTREGSEQSVVRYVRVKK
jgi:uncharacterized protein (TIGR03067 family)